MMNELLSFAAMLQGQASGLDVSESAAAAASAEGAA